ncbi:BMP family ABC transporter substrate-binding protein [Aminobacter sp. Piv2-1]|uniref:BMP family ABC transporter substrate-binding protein n=1 Tax=Aminobacter sp. Piv2-1 TaxID=3031122 RepID=UPI00309A53E0
MSRFFVSLLAVAACALVTVASASAQAAFKLAGPPKVAMIMYSPKDDKAWSEAFENARKKMESDLGIKIALVENIPENATAVRPAVELLISKGVNIIIGTAFGYSDAFKELAEKYPDVAFLNGAGTTNGPNLESFYGRTYESQYLCGMAAGAASKTGKIGYVAPNPFGLVNWAINAFAMGAQQMNPKATVTVIYTGSWNDVVKERSAAVALAEQGMDVLGQHGATTATQMVAQERGIYATGHHLDLSSLTPKTMLCTSSWVWDRLLSPIVADIEKGAWKPNEYGFFASIKDGGTDISCCGPGVPADAAAKIQAERQAIIDGTKKVYAGPLKDRDGKERIPAGAVLNDADLWAMDWYVPGVVSQQ